MRLAKHNQYQRQTGAVIFLALVLLLGISVVSIASMRDSVHQQQISSALMDDSMAFESAEQALNAGEAWLRERMLDNSIQQVFAGQVVDGMTVFERTGLDSQWWQDKDHDNWLSGKNVAQQAVTNSAASDGMPREASYIIEVIGRDIGSSVQIGTPAGPVTMNYRITARGFGVDEGHYVVLQSTVGMKI